MSDMADKNRLLVLKNAVIIDGAGADPVTGGSVVIEGDRIKEVFSGKPGVLPAGVEVKDCGGQTLLPGLIDGHVHICAFEADLSEMKRRNYPAMNVVRSLQILKETLDQGFTTVRDLGGADCGFREAVAKGYVRGPRLSVCGKGLSQTGGHGDARLPTEIYTPEKSLVGMGGVIADGVDACRWAARENIRNGVDFIKVMAGGGCMSPADAIDTAQYSMDELKAVVWEAENAGTYVAAHCYSDRSIINAVESGIRTIEHGNLLTERAAVAIREAGAYLVPTIVTYVAMGRMGPKLGVPEVFMTKMLDARDKAKAALETAFRAGCKIGSGSDLLGPMQVFKAEELALQAQVLGPMGAIVASTRTNAEILRREKDLGTIAAGKLADLILVNGDPLEDISILQNYRERITMIMQGGCYYKNLV
jgi:imidazolonepropionase-like amidohydrolase